uniref:Uncharacterized protein n=1 Tax=Anguilla anguilla TaxID=7936 RepID=A0A0E9Q0B5_ANGAN
MEPYTSSPTPLKSPQMIPLCSRCPPPPPPVLIYLCLLQPLTPPLCLPL